MIPLRTRARPAKSISAGLASKSSAPSAAAFSRTARDAAPTALPVTTAERLAYVPEPQFMDRESPLVSPPDRAVSAKFIGHDLGEAGVVSLALGVGRSRHTCAPCSTRTCAPSYGPMPVPSTYAANPRPK